MTRKLLSLLAAKAMKRDLSALQELVALTGKPILYAAHKLLGDAQLAPLAAKEAFVTVLRNIGRLENPEDFNIWLWHIALDVCRPLLRPASPAGDTADGITDSETTLLAEQVVTRRGSREMLLSIVDTLAPEQKTAVLLFYYEMFTRDEAARAGGGTPRELGDRLQRARAVIRAKLTERGLRDIGVETLMAVPFISRALSDEAERMIPADMTVELWREVSQALGIVPGACGAALPRRTAAKAALTTALTALVLLSGYWLSRLFAVQAVVGGGLPDAGAWMTADPFELPVIVPDFEPPLAGPAVAAPTDIGTIADMLGGDRARWLAWFQRLAVVEHRDELVSALKDMGLTACATQRQDTAVYTLYILKENTRCLYLIGRTDQSGRCGVVYWLASVCADPPPEGMLVSVYNAMY